MSKLIKKVPFSVCIVWLKFIYSEKAKFLRNLPSFCASQKKVEISQNFWGLLRIYELHLKDLKTFFVQTDKIFSKIDFQ